jgi:chromate transporter
MVVQFVGFLAAYQAAGGAHPLWMGTLGALLVVWVTFVPCFLWIFLGAPFVERLRGNRSLSAALAGVTASVVGVIASLALSFGASVLFARTTVARPFAAPIAVPVWGSVDALAVGIAVAAAVAIRALRVNVVWVVVAAGAVGWLSAVVR